MCVGACDEPAAGRLRGLSVRARALRVWRLPFLSQSPLRLPKKEEERTNFPRPVGCCSDRGAFLSTFGQLVHILLALDEQRRVTCDGGYPTRGTTM